MVHAFTNLTSAVRDRSSPLRAYLEATFPDTRPLQAEYRAGCGPLLVPGGSANPATVGTAFDLMLRFTLDPDHVPGIAAYGFLDRPDTVHAIAGVVRRAQDAARAIGTRPDAPQVATLARAAWALALCVDVYRAGLMPTSALVRLLTTGPFTPDALLGLAPSDARAQLAALHAVAAERLLPRLEPVRRLALGPEFDASALCNADADLICDGLLIEVKTRLGTANPRTGERRDSLARADLYQLVAYVVFDRSDAYAIDAIGVYSARYGYSRPGRWPGRSRRWPDVPST